MQHIIWIYEERRKKSTDETIQNECVQCTSPENADNYSWVDVHVSVVHEWTGTAVCLWFFFSLSSLGRSAVVIVIVVLLYTNQAFGLNIFLWFRLSVRLFSCFSAFFLLSPCSIAYVNQKFNINRIFSIECTYIEWSVYGSIKCKTETKHTIIESVHCA